MANVSKITPIFYKKFTNDIVGDRHWVGYTSSNSKYYGFAFCIKPAQWPAGQLEKLNINLNLHPWDGVTAGDRINLKITNNNNYIINNTEGYIPNGESTSYYVFNTTHPQNNNDHITVNFSINFSQLSSVDLTKDVYVYVGSPGETYGYLITKFGRAVEDWFGETVTINVDYQSITAPSTVTNFRITSSSNIYKDGSITLAWNKSSNGINNALSGYKIYCNSTSSTNGSKIISLGADVTSYKILNSVLNIVAGKKGYLAIQAIGTDGGPNSAVSSFISYQVVDKPPDSPTYTVSGTLSSEGNGTITISNLSSNDIDGHEIKYYYNINNASSTSGVDQILEGGAIKISGQPNAKISIWAWANGRFSNSPTTKTINTNVVPKINQLIVKTQEISTYGGYLCTSSITAQAKLNKELDAINYTWTVKAGEKTQIFRGVSELTNQTLNIGENGLPEGSKITVSLEIKDPLEGANFTTSEQKTLNVYTMAKTRWADSISVSCTDEANGTIASKYIYKNFKAEIKFPSLKNFDVLIDTVRLCSRNTAGGEIHIHQTFNFSNGETKEILFTSSIFNYNTEYNFYLVMIDKAGRQTATFVLDGNGNKKGFVRLPRIDIGEDASSSVVPQNWHPLLTETKSSQFTISTRKLTEDEVFDQGIPRYKVYVSVDDGKTFRHLCSADYTANTSVDDIYAHTWSGKVFDNTGLETNVPNYRAIYQLSVINAFGIEGERVTISSIDSQNYAIITQELPLFPEGTNFIVQVAHYDGSSSSIIWGSPEEENKYTYIFNPGEILDFRITKLAIDPNGENVGGYRIQWSSDGKTEWDTFCDLDDFEKVAEDGYYHWKYILPSNLNTLDSIYFRILPIDNTTGRLNTSSCIKNDNKFHYGRKAAIEGQADVSITDSTINCKLSITDFGGDNKGLSNFNRGQFEGEDLQPPEDYYPVTIKVEYSKNSSFTNSKEITWTSSSYPTSNTISFSKSTFDTGYLAGGKVYFKISMILNTNYYNTEYNQVLKTFPIFIFYTDAPTVAHRANHIGINYNKFNEDEVMVVSQFDTRKKIRLIGEYSVIKDGVQTTETRSIDIDLSTGSISEAVIDCGSWSS